MGQNDCIVNAGLGIDQQGLAVRGLRDGSGALCPAHVDKTNPQDSWHSLLEFLMLHIVYRHTVPKGRDAQIDHMAFVSGLSAGCVGQCCV